MICPQESKYIDVSLTKVVLFLPGGFSYMVKGSASASGGIMTAWRDSVVHRVDEITLNSTITTFFDFVVDSSRFPMTNVYAPCHAKCLVRSSTSFASLC